jgi:putative FmdB family regulatory protein
MPIYEYICSKCEKTVDVLQKVSDPAPVKCEGCGAENALERKVSRTSFVLKGGGWYSDLYSSTKKDASGSSSSSPSTSSASSSSSSSSTSSSSSGGSSASGSGAASAASPTK